MAALEHFVTQVRSLSAAGNFAQLVDFVGRSLDTLLKHHNHLDNAVATFDVQQHSIGILAILVVKFKLPSIPDFDALFNQVKEFIKTCNGEQVRHANEAFSELCHELTRELVERRRPQWGIPVLAKAIDRVQIAPSQLTSIHSDLAQVCLLAKNLKPALKYLDVDTTDIAKEGPQGFDVKNFLTYFYYGGMIYAGIKNFERALYFFEIAITTPSMAVSHVMLEAYKKYVLVALLLHGKLPTLPKYTSQVVSRFIKPLSQPYQDLATAYATNNSTEVQAVASKHQDVFVRDKNVGLVKQCVAALYCKNIQRLTKTFLTLSLSDMANRVGLAGGAAEAERHVIKMIEEGAIHASINQKDGMVSFHDNPMLNNADATQKHLEDQMRLCISLTAKLNEMDREICVNPQYVQKCAGYSHGGTGSAENRAGPSSTAGGFLADDI